MENDSVNEPLATYSPPLNFNQVWQLFQETDKKFQETDKQFKETDKKFQKTDKQFQETDKQFKETDQKIKELSALFTSQWGKLIESLVEGDLVKLLNERGVAVEKTLQRVKGNTGGENFEFDIIAVNGDEIVIVEVKTTLRVGDVDNFHKRIWKANRYLPEYANKKKLGAMAYLSVDEDSDRMAEKMGFFVIKATGNSSSITNQKDFKPKAF